MCRRRRLLQPNVCRIAPFGPGRQRANARDSACNSPLTSTHCGWGLCPAGGSEFDSKLPRISDDRISDDTTRHVSDDLQRAFDSEAPQTRRLP